MNVDSLKIREYAIAKDRVKKQQRSIQELAEKNPEAALIAKMHEKAQATLDEINQLLRAAGIEGAVEYEVVQKAIKNKPGKKEGVVKLFIWKNPHTGQVLKTVDPKSEKDVPDELRQWIDEYGILTVATWASQKDAEPGEIAE